MASGPSFTSFSFKDLAVDTELASQEPVLKNAGKESPKENTKRLARCGKCNNCKSQVCTKGLRCEWGSVSAECELARMGMRYLIPSDPHPNAETPARAAPKRLLSPDSPSAQTCLGVQDCGSCYNCADKPKFGGPGTRAPLC